MFSSFLIKPGVYAVRVLFAMLIILSLLAWLAGTGSALSWWAQLAVHLSNGRLNLHAVHGSLYGPLRIEALSFQTDEKRIELKEVNLDWTPASLLRLHIQFNRFTVQELRIIEIKPGTEPAKLPASLHLPVTFAAPAITVDRIVLMSADSQHMVSGIDLGLENSGDSYKLNLRSMVTEWGKGEADIVLADTRPFSISAHATLQRDAYFPYRAEAEASGSLAEFLLKATASALGGQAQINATVTPFGKAPLAAAHITARGINPARFRKDLPRSDLSADISLASQGELGLEGNIMVLNNLPGSWNHSRLPLREMAIQFAGTLDHLAIRTIHLDLARAGTFNGDGQLKNKQLQLSLFTRNFNPGEVFGIMRPMRLAGNIGLRVGQKSQELTTDLHYRHVKLHVNARHQDAVVDLREATIKSGAGNLTLHGTLALEGLKQFHLAGALQQFNPAEFGDYPLARINASFSSAGSFSATPHATLAFVVTDSHFRQQPLTGQGKLSLSATRIWNSDVIMQLERNRLEVKGSLGNLDDRLALSIEAGNLAVFDPELSGQARATATIEGLISAPAGNFDAQVNDLGWRNNYRIDSLQASGSLDKGLDGQLGLVATIQGVVTPQLHIDHLSLNAQGTRIRHTLQVKAKNQDFDIESRFAGGWRGESGWSGFVMDLSNRGLHPIALKAPAKLEVARQYFLLNDAEVDFEDAHLVLHEVSYKAGQFASSGEFKGLSLAYLQSFLKHTGSLKTDLTLNGDWQFAVRDKIDGHIAIWREQGDIFLPNESQTTLGLNRLILSVNAFNNQLQGRLDAAGTRLGSLKADAAAVLSRRNGVWGIAGDAPVDANADLSIESLVWLGPFLDSTGALALDGTLRAKLHAGGTFAQTKLDGTLSGDRFIVALKDQGIRFTEGSFQAGVQDQALHLDHLTMRGGEGNLKGQGRLAFGGEAPVMQLSLQADKLEVFSLPDRNLVLSGTADASATGKKVRVAAKLKADWGLIELPRGDEPTPSNDVVVVNQPNIEEKGTLPYALNFDMELDLGERFFVKGKGLDAQLGGALKLTGDHDAMPSSRGSIHVIKGNYSAYGQSLKIERGILNFQGPLDNPGLDIIALRKNQPVEAGVAINGTAQSPRVKLISNPNVPDVEKLSWLILGHGTEASSGQDFNSLEAAAGVLLSVGESITLQQKIVHSSGLDEFSLKGSGKLEGTVLALGKRLSPRAYLSYEHGFTGESSLVKINYTLTKRLSVQAQAGINPAMDLFYTFEFD